MPEIDGQSLVVRGVEAMEATKNEIARMREALAQLQSDYTAHHRNEELTSRDLDHRLSGIEAQLKRREDRDEATVERAVEARRTAWTSVVGAAKAVWAQGAVRTLIVLVIAGWLGVQTQVIQFMTPGTAP